MSNARRHEHWIDGRPHPPAAERWLESRSPVDGSVVAHIAAGNDADADAAARSAARAQQDWADRPPAERSRVLQAIESGIRAATAELVERECAETGKPVPLAREEMAGTADYFGFYAAAGRLLQGETFDLGPAQHVFTVREPFGVVAAVTPWNYAVNQAARAIAPAIVTGNAVVVKPSEHTSTTTLALAAIATRCGLPDGLLNVVTGRGAEVAEPLLAHPLVRRITFTGSVTTGRRVAAAAAARLIPVTLELGGKSPLIVFADADIERAADVAVEGFLANTGQTCSASTRLLVDAAVEEAFVAALVARAGSRRPGSDLGPLITEPQFDQVNAAFALAAREGAVAVLGGARSADPALANGLYVEPTIYTGLTNDARLAREEIFGPVAVVIPFADEAEAVAIANDSPYGLVAGVWTRDLARGLRVARRLQAGQVFVNGWGAPIEVPFGGAKDSGHGREKGRAALDEYTQIKSVAVTLDPAA